MEEPGGEREHPDFFLIYPELAGRGGEPAPREPTSYWVLLIIVIVLIIEIVSFGFLLDYLMSLKG